jgi:hypothetical protein
MLRNNDLTLWSVPEVAAATEIPTSYLPGFAETLRWTRDYLMNDHAELGREGAVCPFTRVSVDRESFYFGAIHAEGSAEAMRSTVRAYGKWFREMLAVTPERERAFLAFVLLIDPAGSAPAPDVDWLQRASKERFVRDGLMVGQFHPTCDEPGLYNPDFRPLRSPRPLVAIRVMTRYDLPFLMDDPICLEAYLERFATAIPSSARTQLVHAATRAPSRRAAERHLAASSIPR